MSAVICGVCNPESESLVPQAMKSCAVGKRKAIARPATTSDGNSLPYPTWKVLPFLTTSLCERCTKNLEMLDIAQGIAELKTREIKIDGWPVPFQVSDVVPSNTLYLVPSRDALEHALEHDEAPDLRRYFGVIKNIGE